MNAVMRYYEGAGAHKLADLLSTRQTEVEKIMKSINGFVSYSFIRTESGCVSVTICQDKAGIDESVTRAAAWMKENAADTGAGAPKVSQGTVVIHSA